MEDISNLENMIGRFDYSLKNAIADIAPVNAHKRRVLLDEASSSYIAKGDIDSVKLLYNAAREAGREADDTYHKIGNRNIELERLAITDPLTQVFNRRGFEEKAESVYLVEKRNENPMSVLMIDGDHFKNVNDTYGHDVGDDVLEYLGKAFKEVTRESDIVARWGGEEFVIFLPNTDLNGAGKIGVKINEKIGNYSILPDGKKFTVSIGAAELEKSSERSDIVIDNGITDADNALYWMKETGGRNGTAYSSEDGFKKTS